MRLTVQATSDVSSTSEVIIILLDDMEVNLNHTISPMLTTVTIRGEEGRKRALLPWAPLDSGIGATSQLQVCISPDLYI